MPKRNVWKDPSPYGTYQGERGSPRQWRQAFEDVWGYAKGVDLEGVRLEESPFKVLELPEDASFDEVKAAFRRLVLRHHPDHGGDKEKCRLVIAAFKRIKEETGQ